MREELLNPTFKIKKGQWLLMSHEATGLEAVPIPVKTPDANLRLSKWLNSKYGGPGAGPGTGTRIAVRGGQP